MAESNKVDYVVALPTFVGSLLSFMGSAIALGFQIIRPPVRHFRHALIVNLLFADLIYGLGNTISGAVFIIRGRTPSPLTAPDTACLVSGWFSQANAQFVDFNILIMAIVVLLSVIRTDSITYLDFKWQMLICGAAWVPGIITGTIGLTLNSYGYVSGNWCWIRNDRLDLRYALSHGWRIAIFFITIVIYTYIYITLKRVFKTIRSMSATVTGTGTGQDTHGHQAQGPPNHDYESDTQMILINRSVSVSQEMHNVSQKLSAEDRGNEFNDYSPGQSTVISGGTRGNDNQSFKASRMPAPPNVKKMLLMNGYPLAYIVLWIPGIANRLAESVGQSPRWLSALQACTQYIGLINALTYGMSEQMRQGVWRKLKDSTGQA